VGSNVFKSPKPLLNAEGKHGTDIQTRSPKPTRARKRKREDILPEGKTAKGAKVKNSVELQPVEERISPIKITAKCDPELYGYHDNTYRSLLTTHIETIS
jgi:hypothetical protein